MDIQKMLKFRKLKTFKYNWDIILKYEQTDGLNILSYGSLQKKFEYHIHFKINVRYFQQLNIKFLCLLFSYKGRNICKVADSKHILN